MKTKSKQKAKLKNKVVPRVPEKNLNPSSNVDQISIEHFKSILEYYKRLTSQKLDNNFKYKDEEITILTTLYKYYSLNNDGIQFTEYIKLAAKASINPFGYLCSIILDPTNFHSIYDAYSNYLSSFINDDTQTIKIALIQTILKEFSYKDLPKSTALINLVKEYPNMNSLEEICSCLKERMLLIQKNIEINNGIPKDKILESLPPDKITEMIQEKSLDTHFTYIRLYKKYNKWYIAYIGSGQSGRVESNRSTEFATRFIKSIKNSSKDKIIILKSFNSLEDARLAEYSLIRYFRDHSFNLANIVGYEIINGHCCETEQQLTTLLTSSKRNIDYVHEKKLSTINNKRFMEVNEFMSLFQIFFRV